MSIIEGHNTTIKRNKSVYVTDDNKLQVSAVIGAGTASIGTVVTDDTSTAVPTIYNVTMTNANTEYSQALPANCKGVRLSIIAPDGTANFRVAFATGKVATPTAPYLQFDDSNEYFLDNIKFASGTVYFACSIAAKVMQIECQV